MISDGFYHNVNCFLYFQAAFAMQKDGKSFLYKYLMWICMYDALIVRSWSITVTFYQQFMQKVVFYDKVLIKWAVVHNIVLNLHCQAVQLET